MSTSVHDLISKVKAYYPANSDASWSSKSAPVSALDSIQTAYELAKKAHEGQLRHSGEPYITHPLAVASIIADLRLDTASICAGLLHDCVEDTEITVEEISQTFGTEIAFLVDGVTKLGQVPFHNRQERQAENFRKMLLAMVRDIRVILIKLCDRLDNMRTLFALPEEKQQRIAQETMDIYAPLSHRLGIQWIKTELEDLSFRALYPKEYEALGEKLRLHFLGQPTYLSDVEKTIKEALKKEGIDAEVLGRPKHLWSIYQKTLKSGQNLEELYDIIAFRIIVRSVRDCYVALGVIHGHWTPIPGRFKDYIALQKPNRYQSLHTTVIGPSGERIEIQLRTDEMHRIAEEGIAAHWKYKEGQPEALRKGDEKTFAWLHQLMEWQRTLKDPTEFIETVKVDLFEDEVFAFTPQGDVKVLPQGSTPVDFAYLIHTEIGHRCSAARVNGLMVPLHYPLKNGDTVQIITHEGRTPNKDWLKFVVSSHAKAKIRTALRSEQRARSLELGQHLLDAELGRYGLSFQEKIASSELGAIAEHFKSPTVEDLLTNIGYGKILPSAVLKQLLPKSAQVAQNQEVSSLPKHPPGFALSGIKVAGEENILVRFGKCCSPVCGDPIFGIMTRGQGVTIHTKTCPTGLEQDEARRIHTEWDEKTKIPRPVSIQVNCANRPGLLSELSQTFHEHALDITQAHCKTIDNIHAINTFTCRVRDVSQLAALMRSLRQIQNVELVERMQSTL